MISVRLPEELEAKITMLTRKKNMSKSEMIKQALIQYIENSEKEETPYELGKEFFGRYGSGDGNLSVQCKKRVREKINDKNTH